MLRLFKPQIIDLLMQWDQAVAEHKARHVTDDVYEDRTLEVTSCLNVKVEDQIRAVDDALSVKKATCNF